MPPSTTSAGSSSILQDEQVIGLLKRIAGKDEEALKEVQKLLPAAEEAENEGLRQQQRLLNQIRKLQVKLGKKEALILQKDQQMQQFLQTIRQHVDTEKARHKKEVDQLQEEIGEIKTQLSNLKSGKPAEEPQEEDLVEMLGVEDEEKIKLRQQLEDAKANQIQMQHQVTYLQKQMEHFMQTYQQNLPPEAGVGPQAMAMSPGQQIKPPGLEGHDLTKSVVKDVKAPFGLRPHSKTAREAASPYGQAKGPEGGMD